jgi:hypothetical protein
MDAMSHKKKIAAGIAFGACLLLAVGAFRHSEPETGYAFPAIHEVAGMQAVKVRDYEDGDRRSFEIPRHYWPEVLAALSPSEHKTFGGKLGSRGEFEIRAADGKLTYVRLYGTYGSGRFDGFTVGHNYSTAQRNYYRGGNLNKFDSILRRATAEMRKTALSSGE